MNVCKDLIKISLFRQIASASSTRKDLEQMLRSYLNLITAMKDVPDWTKLYHDLNEIVKAAKNSSLSANGASEPTV